MLPISRNTTYSAYSAPPPNARPRRPLNLHSPAGSAGPNGLQAGFSGKNSSLLPFAPVRRDTVSFRGKSTIDDQIREQKRRLMQEQDGALPGRRMSDSILLTRAYYNVTGEKDIFNPILPYRNRLVKNGQADDLKRYDDLVKKIMDRAEFYQGPDYKQVIEPLQDLRWKIKGRETHTQTEMPPQKTSWFARLKTWFAQQKTKLKKYIFDLKLKYLPGYRNRLFMRAAISIKDRGDNLPQSEIDQSINAQTSKLEDPSTEYLMAASIAELYHRRPEWVEEKLNTNGHRPLKIIVTKSNNKLDKLGQYQFGMNTIWMHGPSTWHYADNRNHAGHHEFTHALSESEDGELLPGMTDTQKQEYRELRDEIKKKEGCFFSSLWRKMTGDQPSCGLPEYAFFNDMEFLPVSLDTFKQNPENLCRTEPGKKLYALYKDLLGIDPLNDLTEQDRKPFSESF